VKVNFTWANGTGLAFTLGLDLWEMDTGVQESFAATPEYAFATASGSDILTYTIADAGYYSARMGFNTVLAASTEIPDNFSINLDNVSFTTTTDERWIQLAAPDLDLQAASINGHRILAGACMYTNTSNPLDRGGQIISASLGANLDWRNFITLAGISSVNGSCMKEAKNGVFAHLKPGSSKDFNMQTTFSCTNSTLSDSWFSLRPTCNYIGNVASILTTDGQLGVLTYGIMFEYPSENKMLDARRPMDSVATMTMALNALKGIPQFTENPTHYLQALLGAKRGVGHLLRAVEQYGPSIVAGARRTRRWLGE
jgi:hypothetical protein